MFRSASIAVTFVSGYTISVTVVNDCGIWDHMDNEAKTVKPVAGTAEIDDLTNTGKFEVRLTIPEGDLVLAIDKFNELNPCQNGGIVGFLHEHGTDSGCGITTGRRRSCTSPAGDSGMRRSTDNPSTTTTKCTSWLRRAFAIGKRCA